MTAPDTPRAALGRFIAASGLANLGDGIAVVAWAWMASLLTRDPLQIALMPIALRMPWALFALPAGIVTDRVDRRRLILAMDLIRALAFAAAALAILMADPPASPPDTGGMSALFLGLMLCAASVGTAEVFRDNAAQTMLPAIVPHDTLERANGRLWSVELVGNALLGPAAGAFLIAWVVWMPFALNALLFLLAAAMVLSIRGRFRIERTGAAKSARWRQDLTEGLAFLRGAPLLRLLAVITGIWNLLHQMVVIALVLHVQENLGIGARGYGMILAAGAIGGILGGLIAPRVIKRLGPGRSAQVMTLASAIAFLIVPFAPGGVALACVLAGFECAGLIWNTVSVSYRQRSIPPALLGRVNSIYRLLAWGMMPLGLFFSGLVVTWGETVLPRHDALIAPFVVAGLGAALLTAIAWRPLGRGFAGTPL